LRLTPTTNTQKQKITEKNTATKELKELLNNNKNDCIQTFQQGLTTESNDYSLWMATSILKQIKQNYYTT
jgi:hypothetical protein